MRLPIQNKLEGKNTSKKKKKMSQIDDRRLTAKRADENHDEVQISWPNLNSYPTRFAVFFFQAAQNLGFSEQTA